MATSNLEKFVKLEVYADGRRAFSELCFAEMEHRMKP